ncbi:MAG: L-threonylcarbamoyladenylate synthase [Bryobacteraceae bacterium]|nr:L-threonylcarbamoyladenylate synthase [Bryobacteraceae bacterium]
MTCAPPDSGSALNNYVTPTDLLEIDQDQPAAEAIAAAAALIRQGGVVAIPTDALYTLVADPFNLQAVRRVFAAKGRESLYSLPLLVSDFLMAEELVKEPPVRFNLLARRFWPGALTIIVPASAKVPLRVTGNTGRLGLRQARSKTAAALLELLGQPLVATSANVTGSPTCSSGIEVFGVLDGRIDLVLDGGHCSGTGATTIDITEPYWRLIKEGAVPERDIAECLKQA